MAYGVIANKGKYLNVWFREDAAFSIFGPLTDVYGTLSLHIAYRRAMAAAIECLDIRGPITIVKIENWQSDSKDWAYHPIIIYDGLNFQPIEAKIPKYLLYIDGKGYRSQEKYGSLEDAMQMTYFEVSKYAKSLAMNGIQSEILQIQHPCIELNAQTIWHSATVTYNNVQYHEKYRIFQTPLAKPKYGVLVKFDNFGEYEWVSLNPNERHIYRSGSTGPHSDEDATENLTEAERWAFHAWIIYGFRPYCCSMNTDESTDVTHDPIHIVEVLNPGDPFHCWQWTIVKTLKTPQPTFINHGETLETFRTLKV